jgi:colicin import membrane protein
MSSEKQESSVLFSLKELMNLEEDRIRQEDQDRQRQVDDDRRRQEDEERRLRAEEERRRQEEARKREEDTRLEAIRAAEIEKKRIEAERAAQLEAMSKQQEHARQLAMIEQDKGKKKLRNTLMAVGLGSVVVIGGGLGLYFGKVKPEADRLAAVKEQERQEAIASAERAQHEAKEAQASVAKLMEDLKGAKDEATRKELEARLKEAQDTLANKGKVGGPRVGGPLPAAAGAKPAGGGKGGCPPGDPLCGL